MSRHPHSKSHSCTATEVDLQSASKSQGYNQDEKCLASEDNPIIRVAAQTILEADVFPNMQTRLMLQFMLVATGAGFSADSGLPVVRPVSSFIEINELFTVQRYCKYCSLP